MSIEHGGPEPEEMAGAKDVAGEEAAGPHSSKAVEHEAEAPRGDHQPLVEELPDGSKRYTTRVIRPLVAHVKSRGTVKEQMAAHEKFRAEMAESGREASYPDYRRDNYDYRALMPEIGSPASIEVDSDRPSLIVANVRHLAHEGNRVAPETQGAFRERAEHLLEDLEITDKTLVFVIASTAANYEAGPIGVADDDSENAPTVHSRTDSTVDVVRQLLDERGISHMDNDFGIEGSQHSKLIDTYRRRIDEFQISDREVNKRATEEFKANKAAKSEGQEPPFPDAIIAPPTVYASDTPSLQDLEGKTGMTEVASATVARGLSALDLLEGYFLREGNIPDGVDRVVVITGTHGQFCTDISEALLVATDKRHPIALAENGAYSLIEARLTRSGEVAEDYIIQSGERTGMNVK